MSNLQREHEIMEILKEKTYATVDYLARRLHISTSSIRRDLTSLQEKEMVRRSHGGVSLISAQPGMAPFALRLHENKKEKAAISKAAAKLIKPDTGIYIDSSTIALNMYQYLTPEMNVTVFTNNIQLAQILAARHITTYCVGGCVSEHNNVITTGSYAIDMLKSVYVDMMFFSSSALSEDGMITDVNENETALRKLMLSHAKTRVFLCNHNRFGLSSFFLAGAVSDLNYIISDQPFPVEFTSHFDHVHYIYTS